jgi:hypothetical protein
LYYTYVQNMTLLNGIIATGLAVASKVSIDFCDEEYFDEKCSNLLAIINRLASPSLNSTSSPRRGDGLQTRGSTSSSSSNMPSPGIRPNSAVVVRSSTGRYAYRPTSGTTVGSSNSMHRIQHQVAEGTMANSTVPLDVLTIDHVQNLLEKLNLAAYKSTFRDNAVDGSYLMNHAVDERAIVAMGVSLLTKARLLSSRLQAYKLYGVPRELIMDAEHGVHDHVTGSNSQLEPTSARLPSPERSMSPQPLNHVNSTNSFGAASAIGANQYQFSSPPKLGHSYHEYFTYIQNDIRVTDSGKHANRELAQIQDQRSPERGFMAENTGLDRLATGIDIDHLSPAHGSPPSSARQRLDASNDKGGHSCASSQHYTVNRGQRTSNALLLVGMEVEAKPKYIGTTTNYNFHSAVIIAVHADTHTYDIRLVNPHPRAGHHVDIGNVPRFVLL